MKVPPVYVAMVLLCGLLLTGLVGCSGEKYRVQYDYKPSYSNARDHYRAGTKVKLYYEVIATDTDYKFLLDGEYIPFTYDEKKGFVIEFTMPAHDVTLSCSAVNTMISMEPYL